MYLDSNRRMRLLAVLALCVTLVFSGLSPAAAASRGADVVEGFTTSELGIPAQALPEVSMKAGLLATEDGRILWAREPDQRRAMASITKIMTAVVALEHSKLDDKVEIPKASAQVGESTAFLIPGETLPMRELLEALLVKSGNDAAVAVARHVSSDEESFVKLMNDKAAQLSLTNTRFANSHGLDGAGHYTTATDLAVLSRYAMSIPEFRRVVGLKSVTIHHGRRSETLPNTNLLIGNYRGANGIKTGYTDSAGYCVIDSAERDGVGLYAVVLGTKSELQRFRDARELLDWGYAHYRFQRLASKGTVIGAAPVAEYLDRTVSAAVSEETSVPVMDLMGPITRQVTISVVEAPVKRGQRVGVVTYTQRGNLIASVPLVATDDVPEPSIIAKIGIAIARGWRKLSGG